MYNVFIRWNENTSNYRRFDGGVTTINKDTLKTVEDANHRLVEYLWRAYDKYTIKDGGLFDTNSGEFVFTDADSTEPASVDFGDGTIYVTEVVE